MNRKLNQNGFSPLIVVVGLVVLLALGGAGYYIWQKDGSKTQSASTPETTTTEHEPTVTKKKDPYAGWKTYESTRGDMSYRYPSEWNLEGFEADYASTPVTQPDGDEGVIRLVSDVYTKTRSFGIYIELKDDMPTGYPLDTYPNGKVEKLSSGITLWLEKERIKTSNGVENQSCPRMQIGTDKSFAMKLENGRFLSIHGSYCWGQGYEPTATYDEQIMSTEWENAEKIIKSIRFN